MTKKTLLAALLTTTFMASASFAAEEHKEGGHKADMMTKGDEKGGEKVGISIPKSICAIIGLNDKDPNQAKICKELKETLSAGTFYPIFISLFYSNFDADFNDTCTKELDSKWKGSMGGIRACIAYVWGIGNHHANGCENMHNMGPDLGDNITEWETKLASDAMKQKCNAIATATDKDTKLVYSNAYAFVKDAEKGFTGKGSKLCNINASLFNIIPSGPKVRSIAAGLCTRIGGAADHKMLRQCPARANGPKNDC